LVRSLTRVKRVGALRLAATVLPFSVARSRTMPSMGAGDGAAAEIDLGLVAGGQGCEELGLGLGEGGFGGVEVLLGDEALGAELAGAGGIHAGELGGGGGGGDVGIRLFEPLLVGGWVDAARTSPAFRECCSRRELGDEAGDLGADVDAGDGSRVPVAVTFWVRSPRVTVVVLKTGGGSGRWSHQKPPAPRSARRPKGTMTLPRRELAERAMMGKCGRMEDLCGVGDGEDDERGRSGVTAAKGAVGPAFRPSIVPRLRSRPVSGRERACPLS
jgi:hypothetical protein